MENKLVIVKDNEVILDKNGLDLSKFAEIVDGKVTVSSSNVNYYRLLEKLKLEIELIEKECKGQLKEAMELTGRDKLIQDGFSAKIRAGYTTNRFDSKRFEKECPDIYKEYLKESSVSSSITIDVE